MGLGTWLPVIFVQLTHIPGKCPGDLRMEPEDGLAPLKPHLAVYSPQRNEGNSVPRASPTVP